MNARQLIEAEDPKLFMQQHAPRTPQYYRFSLADGVFCFSIIAVEENQAVERAQQFLNAIGPSWKLWDSDYFDPTVYAPEVTVTADNITTIDDISDIFNDPEGAVQRWEEEFKQLIA